MNRSEESFATAMLIRDIYSRCMNQIGSSMADSGLSYQQVTVIRLIAHSKLIQISEICREMSLTKGTVSGILNRMEVAGTIEKVKDTKDKRITYVRFTEQGQLLAARFRLNMIDSFDRVFAGFTDEDLLHAHESLTMIREKMKEE